MRQQAAMLIVLSMAAGGQALADGTVSLDLASSKDGQIVTPGATIDWTITATVSTGDNMGLALISADLVQDELNPELLDLPLADGAPAEMLGFARPSGIANPAGYEGTQVGEVGAKNLAQIGGAQNVFGEVGPPGMGQDVDVDIGIGQGPGGQVVATGSFTAPGTAGTYTFSLDNAIANVIESIQTPPLPSPVGQATVVIDNGTFSFTVCCLCRGDLNNVVGQGCDGNVDFTDFNIFGNAWLKSMGEPGYHPCADLDGSGSVDFTDFTVFSGLWLGDCEPW